ncbi:DUF397 domain-containing protein [Streptomyces sp. NPDC058464]|uniref:DUF397 domain-containing protein n=1 Tax=Streptomyces sp. NPDC058464 TaxID=3346511 RepID=UPI00365A7394
MQPRRPKLKQVIAPEHLMTTLAGSSLKWRKSTRSAETNCVEVAFARDVLVRDSKDPGRPFLRFSAPSWNSFLDSGRSGSDDPAQAR